jgi:hypothetical protein
MKLESLQNTNSADIGTIIDEAKRGNLLGITSRGVVQNAKTV